MLQQHVEDNAAEGMDDPLETNHTQNGKIEFHDDSDEVQWSLFLPNAQTKIETRFLFEDWSIILQWNKCIYFLGGIFSNQNNFYILTFPVAAVFLIGVCLYIDITKITLTDLQLGQLS